MGTNTYVGPYQLLARIGEGGMGTVYLARVAGGLRGVDKLAVVKVLRADLLGNPDFTAMFLDEARLAARLTHPNVVHTYGADEADGRLYIAMEHLDGQPWYRVRDRLWASRTLPLGLHLRVLADTLAGLHYAHELTDFGGQSLGVVHCDMSPQNVFVTYDGQVKIVDFGVARAAHLSGGVQAETFVGKLSYCAPEQARGESVDRRADVFSVGVMMWEALTGRRFAQGAETSEIRRTRAAGTEPRVRQVAPQTPRALTDMCDRALAIDPGDRFSTAAEFRDRLMTYLAARGTNDNASRLGSLVSESFADDRSRVYRLVERRLADPEAEAPVEDLLDHAGESWLGDHTMPVDLTELASVSQRAEGGLSLDVSERLLRTPATASTPLIEVAPVPEAPPIPADALGPTSNGRSVLRWAGAVAVVALGLLAWFWSRSDAAGESADLRDATAPRSTAAAPAAESSLQAATVAPATKTVELRLVAEPPRASMELDGKVLGGNPHVLKVPVDGAKHELKVRAHGHRSALRILRFDTNREVRVVLSPRSKAPARGASGRRAQRIERSQRERSAAAGGDSAADAPQAPEPKPERQPKRSSVRDIYEEVPF